MRKIRVVAGLLILMGCLTFIACGAEEKSTETEQTPPIEENGTVNTTEDVIEDDEIKEVQARSYDGSYTDMKAVMEAEGISQDEFYEKYGEPVMVYNRFDATNFINLIQDMQKSVHNEMLIADLQQLIDLTSLAAETHEMEYANEIYKILHDLDYFLLRYGLDDVGPYVQDRSVVLKYYGVLNVYGG